MACVAYAVAWLRHREAALAERPSEIPVKSEFASGSERALLEGVLRATVQGRSMDQEMELLLRYAELVRAWNRRGNLVSRGDEPRVVGRHLVESLAAAPAVLRSGPASLIDLGSGGGFPGIPLSIVFPKLVVVLLESRRMKSLFLLQAIQRLQLRNTFVWCARAEELAARVRSAAESGGSSTGSSAPHPDWSREAIEAPASIPAFDLATARAVAPLADLCRWAAPLVRVGGHLLAFKGSQAGEELQERTAHPGPWRLAEDEPIPRTSVRLLLLRRLDGDVSRETEAPQRP